MIACARRPHTRRFCTSDRNCLPHHARCGGRNWGMPRRPQSRITMGQAAVAWAGCTGVRAARLHVPRPALCTRLRSVSVTRRTAGRAIVASSAAATSGLTGADALLAAAKLDAKGLIVAVAQQWDSGEVLMVAWMNADSIRASLAEGRAVYYSRSRAALWRKGEESGNVQILREMLLDCDGDSILLKVEQRGPACHTGRVSCFYTAAKDGLPLQIVTDPVQDPVQMYGAK